MPTSERGSKSCAVSSSTSRRQAVISDSPGSRWPAGWLSTSRPSMCSSTKRKRPPRSITAATVTLGRQTDISFASGSGRFARVFADEIRHALHARLDCLLRRGIGKAHMLALARNAAAEMDVGQHGNTGVGEQPLAEFLGVGGADAAAGFGDVRPDVEGTAGHLTLHAGNVVQ